MTNPRNVDLICTLCFFLENFLRTICRVLTLNFLFPPWNQSVTIAYVVSYIWCNLLPCLAIFSTKISKSTVVGCLSGAFMKKKVWNLFCKPSKTFAKPGKLLEKQLGVGPNIDSKKVMKGSGRRRQNKTELSRHTYYRTVSHLKNIIHSGFLRHTILIQFWYLLLAVVSLAGRLTHLLMVTMRAFLSKSYLIVLWRVPSWVFTTPSWKRSRQARYFWPTKCILFSF